MQYLWYFFFFFQKSFPTSPGFLKITQFTQQPIFFSSLVISLHLFGSIVKRRRDNSRSPKEYQQILGGLRRIKLSHCNFWILTSLYNRVSCMACCQLKKAIACILVWSNRKAKAYVPEKPKFEFQNDFIQTWQDSSLPELLKFSYRV